MMVLLEGSEPKIWRQISVPGNMTLADLDRIIQAAMGWTNSHLHQFNIEGQVYGVLDDEWVDEFLPECNGMALHILLVLIQVCNELPKTKD